MLDFLVDALRPKQLLPIDDVHLTDDVLRHQLVVFASTVLLRGLHCLLVEGGQEKGVVSDVIPSHLRLRET